MGGNFALASTSLIKLHFASKIVLSPPALSPRRLRPIVVIGAGGIVRDAHLPAYRKAGFPVASLHDLDQAKAAALSADFEVPRTPATLGEAVGSAPADAVFDIAVPASNLEPILEALPDGAPVLIQKPFGENLDQARRLLALCRKKRLQAAVNFQLRFAPAVMAVRRLLAEGALGELHDLEVRVTVFMPWHLWTFLERTPRVEILYHSVHYIDLIRSFLGRPKGVYARSIGHPDFPRLASTRTTVILDYGDRVRATVTTNHGHRFGRDHQESYVKWEGTAGAAVVGLGLLLDYPKGEPDTLEVCACPPGAKPAWKRLPTGGNWYPDAFIGSMASLQRFANGETGELPTRVEDAFETMAVVEAAYASSAAGGTPIPTA
jgi:predicted dehydrogenase